MGKSKKVDEPAVVNSLAEVSEFVQLPHVWLHRAGTIQGMLPRLTCLPVEGELILKLLWGKAHCLEKHTVQGGDETASFPPPH